MEGWGSGGVHGRGWGPSVCGEGGGVWGLRAPFSDALAGPIPLKRIFSSQRMGPQPIRPAGGWRSSRGPVRAGVLAAAGPGGGITVSIQLRVCENSFPRPEKERGKGERQTDRERLGEGERLSPPSGQPQVWGRR